MHFVSKKTILKNLIFKILFQCWMPLMTLWLCNMFIKFCPSIQTQEVERKKVSSAKVKKIYGMWSTMYCLLNAPSLPNCEQKCDKPYANKFYVTLLKTSQQEEAHHTG